jgi:hypothetical protein
VKHILAVLSLLCGVANAQVTPSPWALYSGTSIVQPRVPYASDLACVDAAKKMPAGTYTCRGSTKIVNASHDYINPTSIPAPAVGSASLQVRATAEQPTSTDIGAFRTVCKPSHYLRDDPIVFPGKPGASHLHTFFGNTSVNALSTSLSDGSSTCLGGIANRSAYWVPTMLNGGNVVPADSALIYYKRGYVLSLTAPLSALPPGLRMVAGSAASTGAQKHVYHECVGISGTRGASIPSCPAGVAVWSTVVFPQCWNGRDLDSADHKSHMSYPTQKQTAPFNWSCPSTHPVALPEISIVAIHKSNGASNLWRLSSDAEGQHGTSLHADWWNGWNADVMASWLTNCVQANLDCHAHLIGGGRELY